MEDFETQESAFNSRTLGLLLDIELPVTVSFGRTEMPLQDVLKLTTGSIIELQRAIDEPVDLLINQSVIARGTVVVVDGNYGLKIQQIATREQRLQSTNSMLAPNGPQNDGPGDKGGIHAL